LVADEAEALTLFREATASPKHVHADADNVSIKPNAGNARSYTLAGLKRERADL
jgi:hypothetical protein